MRQQWADYRFFLREFRRTFHSTGAVLPSGRALSVALAKYVRQGDGGRRILEVGPGTGAVTHYIVQAMRPDDQLLLVERNDEFVARLHRRLAEDTMFHAAPERITLRHASLEDLAEDVRFDAIISGLPLNNFSVPLVEQILAKLRRLLAPSGTLSFFEYVAIRRLKAALSRQAERRRLDGIGNALRELLWTSEVDRDLVLANVPPAWVHHVQFSH